VSTDRVIFKDGSQTVSCPWEADWPPPRYLYLVPAAEGLVMVNPDNQAQDVIAQLVMDHQAVMYVQQSASKIRRAAEPDQNWFRGALYEPWKLGLPPKEGP
jgi:hypothetical protein